ncbi:MAG: hypothetical protein L6435_15275 [Anaerolineae bacterium]|nr:hypothetical protein [Anaerolineae bacterium]
MLKLRQMQTIAHAAAACGRPDLVEQVERLRAAQAARNREYMRELMFQIEADRLARHAEIRGLIAQFKEEHEIRSTELRELKAEVRSQLDDYATQNREGRVEWQKHLAAVERLRRESAPLVQEDQNDHTS